MPGNIHAVLIVAYRGTQDLLEMTKEKVRQLENVTEHQISKVQAAENEVGLLMYV